ncbi:thioesterase II family protein [Streptomyces sp. NPDC005930]|uniref:thioesterase II family protein n=1 Tax=Streptomyces sp. NPDC005930 TaxID=3364736 RepID=UPI00369F9D01
MPGQPIRPLPRPGARRTLFCLSFCGGGTAPFRPWADVLPEDTELALYCYPGRESRYGEPFARSWDELLDGALTALRGAAERDYVLFGHSMGAAVAFDLALRAERAGLPAPGAVIVSAARPPGARGASHGAPPHSGNTDGELLEWMLDAGQLPRAVREEPELVAMAVEMFRADLLAADSRRHRGGDRLGAPLQVLYGTDDDLDDAAVEAWRTRAAGPFALTRLDGGHFYTPEVWRRLPDRMEAVAGRPAAGEPVGRRG